MLSFLDHQRDLYRPSRRTMVVGFALAQACFCWLNSASVQASCGDYVIVIGEHDQAASSHDGHRDTPCHGPQCKSRDSLPPLPTSTWEFETVDKWSQVNAVQHEPDGRSEEGHSDESMLLLTGFPLRVDRPPRS